jgi:hypothetical protein
MMKALSSLDQALSGKPVVDGQAFSAATYQLCKVRDDLARQQREEGPSEASRKRLERVNGVISVVLAGHFPIGAVPWDELDRARGWLADIAAELG